MLLLKKPEFIIKILIFIIGVFILFKPPIDPDFGWHYKYGEYFFNNSHLLRQNIFSYNFANYEWANSYWLSELALFIFYRFFGTVTAGIIFSAVGSFILTAIFSKLRISQFSKYFGLILAFVAMSGYAITVRPMFFSSIFMFVLMYVLLYENKYLKYLPFLFFIWANSHADFTLGLFVFGTYTFFDLMSNLKLKKIPVSLFSGVLSVAITLINPYGYKLWTTILKETNYFQFRHIAEWLPLKYGDFVSFAFSIYILALVISLLFLEAKKIQKWLLVSAIVYLLLSLRSVYFIRPLFIVSIFSISAFWGLRTAPLFNIVTENLRKKIKITSFYFLLLTAFSVSGIFIENIAQASNYKIWSEEMKLPYNSVVFVKKQKLQGRMFNAYAWGGYLIWQLPEYKTFIDGRMPSWRENDKSVFEDYIDITSDPKKYEKLFNSYNISWVLDKPDSRLVKFLKTKKWKVLYEDKVSIILQNPSDL